MSPSNNHFILIAQRLNLGLRFDCHQNSKWFRNRSIDQKRIYESQKAEKERITIYEMSKRHNIKFGWKDHWICCNFHSWPNEWGTFLSRILSCYHFRMFPDDLRVWSDHKCSLSANFRYFPHFLAKMSSTELPSKRSACEELSGTEKRCKTEAIVKGMKAFSPNNVSNFKCDEKKLIFDIHF